MEDMKARAYELVCESLEGTKYCEHDSSRIVYWSWCTIGEFDTVLASRYNFSPHDIAETHEGLDGTTHVLTAVFEQTVGREADEPYEFIELVDGEHWFVGLVDGELAIIEENIDSQPAYYGGPRDEAATWVSVYGELNTVSYSD